MAICAGLGLLLLMPLVVTPWTLFPFVFGKAIYARGLILVIVALWLALRLRDPAYSPPRSWVLLAFGVYVAVVLLSAVTGVSRSNSLLSNYSRMTGVGDFLLWFLLAVVITATLKSPGARRLLLNGILIAGLLLSLLALAQSVGLPDTKYLTPGCRVTASLGNPSYLAALLVITSLTATGFLVRSFLSVREGSDGLAPPGHSRRPGRAQPGGDGILSPRWSLRLQRAFWLVTLVLGIWVLFNTGTRGALVGLVAGALTMPLALAIWGNRRAMVASALAAGGILCLVFLLSALGETVGFPARPGCQSQVASSRISTLVSSSVTEGSITVEGSVALRLAYIEVGFKALRARPLLGYGHGNFATAFDRFAEARIYQYGSSRADLAHNQPMEELATHGALGLLSFAALWLTLVWAVVRRRRPPPDEILAYAVLGALAGYFVQNVFLFYTPTTMLFWVVLVAWVAGQEPASEPVGQPVEQVTRRSARRSRPAERGGEPGAPRWVPPAVAMALVMLLGISLYYLVYTPTLANRTFARAYNGSYPLTQRLALAADSFDTLPGMSNQPREMVFDQLSGSMEGLSPEEKREVAAFVLDQARRAQLEDPRNVRVVSSAILLLQRAISAEDLELLEPLLEQLREHAPERSYTHVLSAFQEYLKGNYQEAIRIAEEYEAINPWAPESIRTVKQAAQEALDGG